MRIVAIVSGGMDSAVMLYHLLDVGHEVRALAVDYGQRHRRELASAVAICARAGVRLDLADLSPMVTLLRGSSQTDEAVPVPEGHYAEPSMRATVVPNRNMLLLATAAAHAIALDYEAVAYGAHAGDHAIYPDCRPAFVEAMHHALSLCHYEGGVQLIAPFLELSKGAIAVMGEALGVPFELTWTCYKGLAQHCGRCGACTERREAFAMTRIGDPVEYMAA